MYKNQRMTCPCQCCHKTSRCATKGQGWTTSLQHARSLAVQTVAERPGLPTETWSTLFSSECQFLHKKSPSTESRVLLGAVRRRLSQIVPELSKVQANENGSKLHKRPAAIGKLGLKVSFPYGNILIALLIYIIHHPSRVVPLLMHT